MPSLKERDIKLTEDIPASNTAYVQMIDLQLHEFLMNAKKLKDDYLRVFLEQIVNLNVAIEEFSTKAFGLIFENCADSISTCWSECTEEFLKQRCMHLSEKMKCKQTINSSIGLPAKVGELGSTLNNARNLTEEMDQMIAHLKTNTRMRIENLSVDFVCYLQFFTIMATQVYDNRFDEVSASQNRALDQLIFKECPFGRIIELLEGILHSLGKNCMASWDYIISTRDAIWKKFWALVTSRLEALEEFVAEESRINRDWGQQIQNNVEYIQIPFK
jgi:hypothetical protein